jgi:hypothetical protein
MGQVSQLGHSFSWVAGRRGNDGGNRDLEVAVSVRGGKTRIVVVEHLGGLIGTVFGGIGGGMGGGGMGPILGIGIGALSVSATVLVVLIPLWLGTTYAIARTAYHYSTKRRAHELERLLIISPRWRALSDRCPSGFSRCDDVAVLPGCTRCTTLTGYPC